MKDINSQSKIYNENLKAIVNSQGAVDRASAVMNESLKNQEKILENIKKEAATLIPEIISMGDAYSGLAYLAGIVAVPVSVFALGLKEIGLAAASSAFEIKALYEMMGSIFTLDVKGFKDAWQDFLLGGKVFEEESLKSYERIAQHMDNIFKGAEKLRTLNAKRESEERIGIASKEAEGVLKSNEDLSAGIIEGHKGITESARKAFVAITAEFSKLKGLDFSKQYAALKSELNQVLDAHLKLPPYTKEWYKSLGDVLKTMNEIPKIADQIQNKIKGIISEFGSLTSNASRLSGILESIGDTPGAKRLKEETLKWVQSIDKANLSTEQQNKLNQITLDLLVDQRKNVEEGIWKDTDLWLIDTKIKDLVAETFELDKARFEQLNDQLGASEKMASKMEELKKTTEGVYTSLELWVSSSDNALTNFRSTKLEMQDIKEELKGIVRETELLAEQIKKMPKLNIGTNNFMNQLKDELSGYRG